MTDLCPDNTMQPNQLTKEEQKWLKKLEKVLTSCPTDRFGCYTTGDNCLTFYDKQILNDWQGKRLTNEVCVDVAASGAYLGRVYADFNIESTAG